MNLIGPKVLVGDRANYIGINSGLTFAVLHMTEHAASREGAFHSIAKPQRWK